MKKMQEPIYKYPLEDYEGKLVKPELTDILEYYVIKDKTFSDHHDMRIVFDSCKFNKVTFNQNEFQRAEFLDCVFENCDLSNNSFIRSTFIRCQFINCRFTGSHFVESYLKFITFKDCIGNFLDVADSKLEIIEFINMNLLESSFFTNTFKQVTFKDVKLEKATFYETTLKDVDLRSCDIYNLKVDAKSIKGSIISSFQAPQVCHLLGIKVED